MRNVHRVELRQYRHYDCTVSDCGNIQQHPFRRILAAYGYFRALPDSRRLIKEVYAGDYSCHVSVSQCLAANIIGQGGEIPVLYEATFIYLYEIINPDFHNTSIHMIRQGESPFQCETVDLFTVFH